MTTPGNHDAPRERHTMMAKKRLALHWTILIGLALGVGVGLAINLMWDESTWASTGIDNPQAWIAGTSLESENTAPSFGAHAALFLRHLNAFVGDLFLRLLRFIAVPIVLFSLIAGVASLNDTRALGRMGTKTLGLYLSTTAIAITVGIVLANLVSPGANFNEETKQYLIGKYSTDAGAKIVTGHANAKSGWDAALDIIPKNPFTALAETQMIQIVFAALLIGIGLSMIPKKESDPIVRFFQGMTDAVIKVVHIVLLIAPIAVFALIVEQIADLGLDVLAALAKYSITVVLGLAIMIFAVYPLILRSLGGVPFAAFLRAISPAQLLAFSSSSSAATLPVTMDCCENRLGVKEEVSSFVLPLGATINMDGTALYQGVAAIFIAQMFAVDLSIMQQITIVLTTTVASIGTAAVPSAGIVMLVIVLESVGLPVEGIALILGVDRILDMCRTSCNVTGDCMVAAVIGSTEGGLHPVVEPALDEHPPT